MSVESSENFTVDNVRTLDNGSYGIRSTASTNGQIKRVFSSGHSGAGIAIEKCAACGILVERARSKRNFVGLQITDASGAVVRRSVFEANANGLVLRAAQPPPGDGGGTHVYDNKVRGNGHPNAPAPSAFEARSTELPAGAGVWVQGGSTDVIEANTVSDNHYGIVLTASSTLPRGERVADNYLVRNTVDLAWDGLGHDVCFEDNAYAVSEPPRIQQLYACGRQGAAGVAYPKVTLDLMWFAFRTYYCTEIDERLCI